MDPHFFTTLENRIGRSLMRFPAAYGMLVLLVTVLLVNVLFPKLLSETQFSFAWQFSAIGFLVALALDMMRDRKVFRSRGWLVEALGLVAWAGLMVWYARHPGIGAVYGEVSIAVAAVVAGLTVPFWQDREDERFCLGLCDILRDGFSSGLVTGVLLGCLMLLVVLGNLIFGGEGDVDGLAQVVATLFGLGLFGVLFLARIPEPWPSGKGFSRILEGAAKWLFLPLLGVYLVTLYIYAIRILLQWKLPDGSVAVLITVSMALLLFVVYVLAPLNRKENPETVQVIHRVLPWLMIPLLVLMSVGIVRRVSDYGWTVDRVYLALFNLWCFGVCLYLGLTGCRKIRWIPVSFALILFLASIGPWNVSRMVRKGMVKEVRVLVGDAGLPMTASQMSQLGPSVSKAIQDKLKYLQDNYGSSSVEEFAVLPFYPDLIETSLHKTFDLYLPDRKAIACEIPDGFRHCMDYHWTSVDIISVSEDSFRFSLSVDGESYWFDIPFDGFDIPISETGSVNGIKYPIRKMEEPIPLPAVNNSATLFLCKIEVDGEVLDDVQEHGLDAKRRKGYLTALLFY